MKKKENRLFGFLMTLAVVGLFVTVAVVGLFGLPTGQAQGGNTFSDSTPTPTPTPANGSFAAQMTIVVDDDGMGIIGNCDDLTPTFMTIQAAVNAANAGDQPPH